jgi:GTP-binding protein
MRYRNLAIIAHVDHGKTTLVDGMLRQANVFGAHQVPIERVMDSNALERERGITILAKNTGVVWRGERVNIVDTPGHADFGGEVERALGMVDSCLLLVDAAEGPMPQTRFVLRKALALGLKPIVIINKVDRKDARPDEVASLTFDLMVELGADDEQLDFPLIHAVAREGRAWRDGEPEGADLTPLFETILEHAPAAAGDVAAPFQLQVANLDYSDFLGRLAIGRVRRGSAAAGDIVVRLTGDGGEVRSRLSKVYTHLGLQRLEAERAVAGDIVALAGIDEIQIGETIAAPEAPEALPRLSVDEPTVSVVFSPNTSPFAGRDGRYVTSRHIAERLERELLTNVALRVEPVGGESYRVSGRGELHLSILIEQMRREGFEFSVSRPQVIMKTIEGVRCEPFERVVAEVSAGDTGAVIEALAARRGQLLDLQQRGTLARLTFSMPSRGLFGFRTQFLSMTQGEGLLSHIFDGYAPYTGPLRMRTFGSLVAMEQGEAFAYALWKLQDRGVFFIGPGTEVYVGMVVGANNRPGDLDVNLTKNKKLTNVRAAGSDDNVLLVPAKRLSLEACLEYLADDELLEVTPAHLRLRKRTLDPHQRKREAKRLELALEADAALASA